VIFTPKIKRRFKNMSKWINKDLFGKFQEEKKQEKEAPNATGINRMEYLWKNPEKGTETTPKVYVGRFLPDKKDKFYDKYSYHMFKTGEKWAFFLCKKTYGMEEFCPLCEATRKLYMGSAADKKMAYNYKRKDKFVGNFYVIDDPRDGEREKQDKVNGTVKLYEFPGKVEMKLKEQITDSKYGLGPAIFDPGVDGYDFIIKVLSTKKDEKGNVWPDYSNSEFSRKPYALKDSDQEIKQIMESRIDIDEYIKSMDKTDEEMIAVLKSEMLWDLVKDEYNRKTKKETKVESTIGDDWDDSKWDNVESSEEEEKTTNTTSSTSEDSDEELLKELENL
jgi:hypothetical protein